MIINQCMNGLTKNGGAADAGKCTSSAKCTRDFWCCDLYPQRSLRLDFRKFAQGIWRTVGDEFAVIDVCNVAAAFCFVHVMRSDKKRDPMRGKFEEQIPQLATRHGIDARRWLIEKK